MSRDACSKLDCSTKRICCLQRPKKTRCGLSEQAGQVLKPTPLLLKLFSTLIFAFSSAKVYPDTSQGDEAPYLYLSGTLGADGSSGLPAIFKNASEESSIADEIIFVYTVEFGDSISGTILEVDDRFAIREGTAPFVDLLGRDANVTLPVIGSNASLSGTASLSVDSAEPVVTAIGSFLFGGEYGVGQVRPSAKKLTLLCIPHNVHGTL